MDNNFFSTRRGFLRNAVASAVLSPALKVLAQAPAASETVTNNKDAAILSRVALDREVADQDGVLNGTLRFQRPVSGPVEIQWVDSFGRVADEMKLPLSGPSKVTAPFSFNMRAGLTYVNWIRVKINGVMQSATASFMLSPRWTPWDDYHNILWSHYPDGYYGLLRETGIDATIAYINNDFPPVLDNNFKFYVEQMAWEVYSIYHKDVQEWRNLTTKISMDRENLELWVRNPCVNDPKTQQYVREHLTQYVRERRAFRPLFYNIADELGQADQISPNDFCHSRFCAEKFSEYLHRSQGGSAAHPRTVDTLADLTGTTTDKAFEAIGAGGLITRYGDIAQFNKAWGTDFPEPRGGGSGARDGFAPVLGLVRESLSVPVLDDASLEKAMGPLTQANARWGGMGPWNAPNKPTTFKSWSQVTALIQRYYKELAQTNSTKGWDVSSWCVFRNFMDETFADAVKLAGDVCRAEDPHALCGTEGGQAPFAFGWYNYEQVVRAVDVIEPYNIGGCVEVIRSLKPEMIMLQTRGSRYTPGQPITAAERIAQRRLNVPIWWGLFHDHNGAILWDDNETGVSFIDEKTGKLTPAADTFSATLLEMRAGIGKLFINAKRAPTSIAIHYSQPSIQIHWLLDNLKYAREWMLRSGGYSDSLSIAVRNSWTKLIEDLALQYNFIGGKQIESGILGTGEYSVFIMPQSIAVSQQEAEQIRTFVQNGGTLIADYRAADLNGKGRDLGHGLLNDVFGITHGPAQTFAKSVQGVGNEGGLQLEGKQLREIRPGDATVLTTTGNALAQSGPVPMVIVNQFGSGRAIFLNMEIADYAYLRLKPDSNTSLPELVNDIFGEAQIKPSVRVLGADGKRLPGTEVVTFNNGSCEMVSIFRNPQADNGGWASYPKLTASGSAPVIDPALVEDIDNSLLEEKAEVTLEWTTSAQTYDVRGRKDLGKVQTLKTTLDPWEPLVFTRSAQSLPALKVTVSPGAAAGKIVEVELSDESALPEGTYRVVHLEFKTPSGESYDLYTRNVLAKLTPHVEQIPFAFNDPKGNWRVIAHDLLTGQVIESRFTLV